MLAPKDLSLEQGFSCSIRNLYHIIYSHQQGILDLNPDYQRGYVWTVDQKKALIESINWGLPLPAMYFVYKSKERKMEVLDGKQRCSAILGFVNNEFDCNGTFWGDLNQGDRSAFELQRTIAIVELENPSRDLMLEVLKRINVGGTQWIPNV